MSKCKCGACYQGYNAFFHSLLYQVDHGRCLPEEVSDEHIPFLIAYLDFDPHQQIR
jgi:hypothetical protein